MKTAKSQQSTKRKTKERIEKPATEMGASNSPQGKQDASPTLSQCPEETPAVRRMWKKWHKIAAYREKFRDKLCDDYRELFTERLKREQRSFGDTLWSSLANVGWYHKSDPKNTKCSCSFRGAGGWIAAMLGDDGEMSYLKWCFGTDGVVSKYIGKKMAERGWYCEPHGAHPSSKESDDMFAEIFGETEEVKARSAEIRKQNQAERRACDELVNIAKKASVRVRAKMNALTGKQRVKLLHDTLIRIYGIDKLKRLYGPDFASASTTSRGRCDQTYLEMSLSDEESSKRKWQKSRRRR